MKGKLIAPNMSTKIGLIEHIYFVIFCAGCVEGAMIGGSVRVSLNGGGPNEEVYNINKRTIRDEKLLR